MRRAIGLAIVWVCACGPDRTSAGTGDTDSTSSASSSSTVDTTTDVDPTTAGPTSSTSVDPGTSSSEGSSSDTTAIGDDVASECTQCDTFAQNCPAGERCVPWSCDGSPSWNGTRCSPIADEPAGVGEACTVQQSRWSGLDDCERGAMCWSVDTITLEGTCVGLCVGTPDDPVCADSCAECRFDGEGVLAICLASCDPLMQDCAPDEGCYLAGEAYVCAQSSAPDAVVGDPCDGITGCAPGDTCINGAFVPGCAEGDGCCTAFCTVGDPDGCAALPGTTCAAVFLPGEGPACIPDTTGICVEP